MLRRINFYSICFAFGLSVLLILAGSRYTDNTFVRLRPSLKDPKVRRVITTGTESVRASLIRTETGEYLPQPLPTNSDDGSVDIEMILTQTRTKIKTLLTNYNFSRTNKEESLDSLLFNSGGQPLRSLILSTWRSGTTFLGEVLNSIPGNYYHYEPLLKNGIIQIRGPPEIDEALSTIKNMFNCDYKHMNEYFEFGKDHHYQFSHNTRLWNYCKYDRELCLDANFTSKFCKLFPFQSMKVVRVRLYLIEELLQDSKLQLKVVFLVRDPRGVMQSRHHRIFCQPSPDCWQPELLCSDMISDYVAAAKFVKLYPDKFMVLRYEDLALNTNLTTQNLLKFLGLSMTPSLDEFLHTHTNVQIGGVSSTFRVSREVPFRWKNILNYSYVDEIQTVCKEAMNLWGFTLAYNATHMESKEFIPIYDYNFEN